MTTATVDHQPSSRARRPSVGQPARRPATTRPPLARPAPISPRGLAPDGPWASRGVVPLSSSKARACRLDPVTRPSAQWRLTDRGIALVLVLTVMIVLAALTVIGLTAWRVTGPRYQTTDVAQISQR